VTMQSSLSNVGGGSKTAAFDITFKSHCWDATFPAKPTTAWSGYSTDLWATFGETFTPATSS